MPGNCNWGQVYIAVTKQYPEKTCLLTIDKIPDPDDLWGVRTYATIPQEYTQYKKFNTLKEAGLTAQQHILLNTQSHIMERLFCAQQYDFNNDDLRLQKSPNYQDKIKQNNDLKNQMKTEIKEIKKYRKKTIPIYAYPDIPKQVP
jgi:hypothetical protein